MASMGILAAIYGFLQSPLGQVLIVAPIAAWFVRKASGDRRAGLIVKYAVLAFEAVEPMAIPGVDKYKKAVGFWIDALRKAGLKMPSAKEMLLFEELAAQYSLSKKPAGKKK